MKNNTVTHFIITEDSLVVYSQKNRIYCILETDIADFSGSSGIRGAWRELGGYLSREFTTSLDTGIEKVQRPGLIQFLLSFQQIAVVKGGVKLPKYFRDPNVAYLLHEQIAEMAGTKHRRRVSDRYKDAEEWLDVPGV